VFCDAAVFSHRKQTNHQRIFETEVEKHRTYGLGFQMTTAVTLPETTSALITLLQAHLNSKIGLQMQSSISLKCCKGSY